MREGVKDIVLIVCAALPSRHRLNVVTIGDDRGVVAGVRVGRVERRSAAVAEVGAYVVLPLAGGARPAERPPAARAEGGVFRVRVLAVGTGGHAAILSAELSSQTPAPTDGNERPSQGLPAPGVVDRTLLPGPRENPA